MNEQEIKLSIQEFLNRPLTQKVRDMLMAIDGHLTNTMKECEECQEPCEYARMNGEIYAFSVCKGMLQSIIRLEEIRSNH